MRIEASTVNKGWYTVHVDAKELVTQSGKVLPYYKPAAMAVLEAARTALREAGKVK
jgi:hypothetical protein